MSEKIYCGSGKKKSDKWLSVTVNTDKIKDHIEDYNGNKFVKLNININDQPNEWGKDVSVSIDTWKPENVEAKPQKGMPTEEAESDSLPF